LGKKVGRGCGGGIPFFFGFLVGQFLRGVEAEGCERCFCHSCGEKFLNT